MKFFDFFFSKMPYLMKYLKCHKLKYSALVLGSSESTLITQRECVAIETKVNQTKDN